MDELYQSPADQFIISSSLEILKNAHPSGLTIKELNESLISTHKQDIQGILKSSTILSTKLNAFYRKCQNLPSDYQLSQDSLPHRFKICPLIRQNAADNSKRLVYKYCKSLDDIPQEELAMSLPSIPIMSPKSPLSPPRSDDADLDENENETLASRLSDRLSPESPSSTTTTTPAPATTTPYTSPYHLRRVIKKTAHAFVPPSIKRRSSSSVSVSPAPAKRLRISSLDSTSSKPSPVAPDYEAQGGINLYYDFPETPVLPKPSATLAKEDESSQPQAVPLKRATTAPIAEQLDWFSSVDEFITPEAISFDELDSMFD